VLGLLAAQPKLTNRLYRFTVLLKNKLENFINDTTSISQNEKKTGIKNLRTNPYAADGLMM
jgi:hypothetical protein